MKINTLQAKFNVVQSGPCPLTRYEHRESVRGLPINYAFLVNIRNTIKIRITGSVFNKTVYSALFLTA